MNPVTQTDTTHIKFVHKLKLILLIIVSAKRTNIETELDQ